MTRGGDEGTITLLTLGFIGVLLALVVTVVDVSAIYLDRRDVAGECDSAALAAAQSVDPSTLYATGIGTALPVTAAAGSAASAAVTRVVGAGTATVTTVEGDAVTVACTRRVTVPIGAVIGVRDFTVRAASTAQSPVR